MRFITTFLLCFLLGCGFLPKAGHDHGLDLTAVQGQIIQPEVLRAGGGVSIVPFSAGVHTLATEELDGAALILVRGIQDGLMEGRSSIEFLSDGELVSNPKMIITGHIERMEIRGGWKRYIGGSRERLIEIDGKVVDAKGELVAVFHHMVRVRYQDMSQTDAVLKIGYEIGQFLMSEH
jgi:hypothetical protein